MATIAILASGTRGDVQPAIALGVALGALGHGVRVLAGSSSADWIRAHGLEAAPSGVDMQAVMASERGRAWVERGHDQLAQRKLMRAMLDDFGARQVRDAWEAAQGADLLVTGFASDAYGLVIGERLGIPVASLALQPSLTATSDGRAMTVAPFGERRTRLNRWFGARVLEPFPWALYGSYANTFAREVGAREHDARWFVAARRAMPVAHAISPAVLARPDDWPAGHVLTGFCFLDDEAAGWHPSPELAAFVDPAAGPPPIAVGFGSMAGGDPAGTARLVLDAVAAAGRRAVLVTGWGGIGAGEGSALPASVIAVPEAPYSWLFPRVAAAVHHGGAGTTAATMRAGIPAVVVPHMADQPWWGRRVHGLGVGPRPIARHRLTAASLAAAIREATTTATMGERARALGETLRAEPDGAAAAAAFMARLLGA